MDMPAFLHEGEAVVPKAYNPAAGGVAGGAGAADVLDRLEQVLRERGAPPVPQSVAWMMDVLDAVAVAHVEGVVHRDIKPSNILVDAAGRARVMDFGIAARLQGVAGLAAPVAGAGTVEGWTPNFRKCSPIALVKAAIRVRCTPTVSVTCPVVASTATNSRPFAAASASASEGYGTGENFSGRCCAGFQCQTRCGALDGVFMPLARLSP